MDVFCLVGSVWLSCVGMDFECKNTTEICKMGCQSHSDSDNHCNHASLLPILFGDWSLRLYVTVESFKTETFYFEQWVLGSKKLPNTACSVHPIPDKVRRGHGGGSRRGFKLVPLKLRCSELVNQKAESDSKP